MPPPSRRRSSARGSTAPSRTASSTRGHDAGRCSASVAVISAWPPPRDEAGAEELAALRVELGGDVVEQHQRRRCARRRGARRARRRAAPGAPCAAVPATRSGAPRARRRAIASSSRCGPWPLKPRARSDSRRSASSARSSSASAAWLRGAVARARRRRRARARPAAVAKSGASSSTAAARVAISSIPAVAELRIPGVERIRPPRAGADPADQRVPLRERARVAPAGLGARRVERGDEAVEVRRGAPRAGP